MLRKLFFVPLLFVPLLAIATTPSASHQGSNTIISDKQPSDRNAHNSSDADNDARANSAQPYKAPISINAAPAISIQPYVVSGGDSSGGDAFENLVKIVSDIAIAAFTAALGLVAYWQFGALRDQVRRLDITIDEARKDGERQSADVKESIAAAQESTRATIETMKRHAEIELRPYIMAAIGDSIETPISQNGKVTGVSFEFHPIIHNTGRTPAHDLVYVARCRILPMSIAKSYSFELPQGPNPSVTVIGPGQQTTMIVPLEVTEFLTPAEVEKMKGDKLSRPFIWGTIIYRDPLALENQPRRTTNFCYYVVWGDKGLAAWIAYNRHNDAT